MILDAVIYDCECGPNYFTYTAVDLNSGETWYFEISEFRSDITAFWHHLNALTSRGAYMIGFNNIGYDYNLIHAFYAEPVGMTNERLYQISQSIINSFDRFGQTVRPDDRFIKQIDLYKIHHFDNNNKRQSLKGLEVNMRSDSVVESTLPFNIRLTADQINGEMKPYNAKDVIETAEFARISMPMIEFRLHMSRQISGDVLNFNEAKIGKELLAQRMGDAVTYHYVGNKREKRKTPRDRVALSECIFPYIRFNEPEFNRVLNWISSQTITETKGVFENLTATVGGLTFKFGTGGLHGSVERQRFFADDEWAIIDDDVGGYYPSVIIANRLAPEHLGDAFRHHFGAIKEERKQYPKDAPENGALKLAGNAVFGDSNNQYGYYFDPKFMLMTTINGQLMLCMLAEWLLTIPTLSLIQANTDGLTYRVHRAMLPMVEQARKAWMDYTCLELEQAQYKRMLIRDVNNYIAETESGKLKLKGAYWSPRNESWAADISRDMRNPGPPAWHKDYSFVVVQRAAVEHMLNGTDITTYVYSQTNPFDFMGCEKVDRKSALMIGNTKQQRVTRYYVAKVGEPMRKIMPSTHPHRAGQFKAARTTTDEAYNAWHAANGNVHNPAIHTKNRSTYEPERVTNINVGMMVRNCNAASSFDWMNLNYEWYINEARKLVI